MKNKLSISALCVLGQFSMAQLSANGTLAIQSNKILYDNVTEKIYAAVPSTNGSTGNSLAVINPKTISVEKTIFAGSEPSVLAISDNSQYIYVGFRGSNSIRKFDVASQTFGTPFTTGTSVSYGPLYPGDIKVMPGNPNTIAVSRKQFNTSATFKGVAIYDNGVMRPTTSFNPESFTYDSADVIEFETPEYLIGLTTGSSDAKIRRIKVTSAGATDMNQNVSVSFSYPNNFKLSGVNVILDNGQVFDYKNGFLLGSYSGVKGQFSIDPVSRLITYAAGDYYNSSSTAIKRFNMDTFLPVDTFPLSINEPILSVVNCGTGCIAYNTLSKIYFLKDEFLAVNDLKNNQKFVVSPNPVGDVMTIVTDKNIVIKSVKIYDTTGKLILDTYVSDNKVKTTGLGKGTYYVTASDNYGRIHNSKIIKN